MNGSKNGPKKSLKWQRRWDISETGRHLYKFQKKVKLKKVKFEDNHHQRNILKLQSGYCLNEYKHKLSIVDSLYCECGSPESITHFFECKLYETSREKIRQELYLRANIKDFSAELFLTVYDENDPQKDCRVIINENLGTYIEASKRF